MIRTPNDDIEQGRARSAIIREARIERGDRIGRSKNEMWPAYDDFAIFADPRRLGSTYAEHNIKTGRPPSFSASYLEELARRRSENEIPNLFKE